MNEKLALAINVFSPMAFLLTRQNWLYYFKTKTSSNKLPPFRIELGISGVLV